MELSHKTGEIKTDDLISKAPEPFASALVEVLDTADICRRWFGEAGLNAAASDIVALTKLVVDEARRRRTFDFDNASGE